MTQFERPLSLKYHCGSSPRRQSLCLAVLIAVFLLRIARQ